MKKKDISDPQKSNQDIINDYMAHFQYSCKTDIDKRMMKLFNDQMNLFKNN